MNIESVLKKHVDKRLIQRIRMLVIILVIMTAALVYEILTSRINLLWVLGGVIFGIIVGALAGRMFSIEWHEEKNKVIGRLDVIGIIVLILYIAVSVARYWLFAQWFVGAILTAFTLSFVEGVMLGRLLSMRINIRKVLVEQGKM